jgi:hypothetical protein
MDRLFVVWWTPAQPMKEMGNLSNEVRGARKESEAINVRLASVATMLQSGVGVREVSLHASYQ